MAKISRLTAAADVDGSETVVLVKDGQTRRSQLTPLVAAAVAPFVNDASASATAAAAFTNFIQGDLAAAEAATEDGDRFSISADGELIAYVRTAGGSVEIGRAVTPAMLAESAAIVGITQDSPMAIRRTIKNQLLDTWSIEQFVPLDQINAIRARTSAFDMGSRLEDVIGTIQTDRPGGLLTSQGGKVKSNRTMELDAQLIQTAFRCQFDMTDNDDEFGVAIGSSGPGGALSERRCRISGLNLIGEDGVNKGQIGIALAPALVGGGQLNQLTLENIALHNWSTMIELRDNVYCTEIEKFLFNIGLFGLTAPTVLSNGGERVSLLRGTMASVECGIYNNNHFCSIYARSVSFDYPVRWTDGPRWLDANKGIINAQHCHFEGNNGFSPMDQDDPARGLFRMGSASSAKLDVEHSWILFSNQYQKRLGVNQNTGSSMGFRKNRLFNVTTAYDGFLFSGDVDLELDSGITPQTFFGINASRANNICPDTFEGDNPIGWTITQDQGAPVTDPWNGSWIDLTNSNAEALTGAKSLAIKHFFGAGPGATTRCARYLPISKGAICGVSMQIKKPGTLEGNLTISLEWVAGRYRDNGLFEEARCSGAWASDNPPTFTPAPTNWSYFDIGGVNSRAPGWATHLKLEIFTGGLNTSTSASEAAAGLVHIDDVFVTRMR